MKNIILRAEHTVLYLFAKQGTLFPAQPLCSISFALHQLTQMLLATTPSITFNLLQNNFNNYKIYYISKMYVQVIYMHRMGILFNHEKTHILKIWEIFASNMTTTVTYIILKNNCGMCDINYQEIMFRLRPTSFKSTIVNEQVNLNLLGLRYLNASTRRPRDRPLLVLVLVSCCSCFRCQKPLSSFSSHLSPFLFKNSNSQINNN